MTSTLFPKLHWFKWVSRQVKGRVTLRISDGSGNPCCRVTACTCLFAYSSNASSDSKEQVVGISMKRKDVDPVPRSGQMRWRKCALSPSTASLFYVSVFVFSTWILWIERWWVHSICPTVTRYAWMF